MRPKGSTHNHAFTGVRRGFGGRGRGVGQGGRNEAENMPPDFIFALLRFASIDGDGGTFPPRHLSLWQTR